MMRVYAMRRSASVGLIGIVLLAHPISNAQTSEVKNYFTNWDNRVRQTMGQQPNWVVPLVTGPSGIYQLLRLDFSRQVSSSHVTTWNIEDGKGLILIPWYKTELDIFGPSYL